MKLLAVIVFFAALAVAQANVGFFFFQGFQTKSSADTYHLSITATTDRGSIVSSSSAAMKFSSKYGFNLTNADLYVTNITATLFKQGSSAPVATLTTNANEKLYNYNFFLVAHTVSYDSHTGANTPKLSYSVGSNIGYSVTVMAGNFFYSADTSVATYSPPYSYSIYDTYDTVFYFLVAKAGDLGLGQVSAPSLSNGWPVYTLDPARSHKFCSAGACVTANSSSYAGNHESFVVLYLGNSYLNNKVGVISFGIPPSTL